MRLNPKFAAVIMPLTLALQGCGQAPDSLETEGAKAVILGNSKTCQTSATFAKGDFTEVLRAVLNNTDSEALQTISSRGIRVCLDADLGTKQTNALMTSRLVAAFSHTENTIYLGYDADQQSRSVFVPSFGGTTDALEIFAQNISETATKNGVAADVACISLFPCSSIKWGTEADFPKSVANNRAYLPF